MSKPSHASFAGCIFYTYTARSTCKSATVSESLSTLNRPPSSQVLLSVSHGISQCFRKPP
jgi:hypothetical protein